MLFYITKIIITTLLVVLVSEITKRSSLLGGVLASVPLVSVLAMVWLYVETGDGAKVVALSNSIFWLIFPSLTLFVALPVLMKKGFGFYPSMAASIVMTVIAYYLMIAVAEKFGMKL